MNQVNQCPASHHWQHQEIGVLNDVFIKNGFVLAKQPKKNSPKSHSGKVNKNNIQQKVPGYARLNI
jgi:hypothetical protein